MGRTAVLISIAVAAASIAAQAPERTILFRSSRTAEGLLLDFEGKAAGPYRELYGAPALSPDGRHWGLAVRLPGPGGGPGGGPAVVIDGAVAMSFGPEYAFVTDLRLGADPASWEAVAAPVAAPGGRPSMMKLVDGATYGPYRQAGEVVRSPSGGSWFFVAEKEEGRYLVTKDGPAQGPYSGFVEAAYGPDGTRLTIIGGREGGLHVRQDGKELGPFRQASLVKDSSGACLGYIAQAGDQDYRIEMGGRRFGPYSWTDMRLDYLSPDGAVWKTRVYRQGASFLLDTGTETARDRLDLIRSPGGVLFSWKDKSGNWIEWKGSTYGPLAEAGDIFPSADGAHLLFSQIRRGAPPSEPDRRIVTVDGVDHEGSGLVHGVAEGRDWWTWLSGGRTGDAFFVRFDGAMSERRLYQVRESARGTFVETGSASLGPYARIADPPVASADGAHWGFLAQRIDGSWVAVVDGRESAPTRPFVNVAGFSISENGASWAFSGWPDRNDGRLAYTLVSGKEYGPFIGSARVCFSADGSRFYFWNESRGKAPGGAGLAAGKHLVFSGKAYGPYPADQAQHLYDLEGGRFVFLMRDRAGVTVRMGDRTYGPYRDAEILAVGPGGRPAEADEGPLFGFIATLKDGTEELRVAAGNAGGERSYGPYQRVSRDNNAIHVSPGGREWFVTAQRKGGDYVLLRSGKETASRSFDLRPLAEGFLLMTRQEGKGESIEQSGRILGTFGFVDRRFVSADGRRWIAEVQQGDGPDSRRWILVDGAEYRGGNLSRTEDARGETYTWFHLDEEGRGILSTLSWPRGQ